MGRPDRRYTDYISRIIVWLDERTPELVDERARLTLPDVGRLLFVVAILGVLGEVFYTLFESQRASLDAEVEYLFYLVVPLTFLVLLAWIFAKAGAGGAR